MTEQELAEAIAQKLNKNSEQIKPLIPFLLSILQDLTLKNELILDDLAVSQDLTKSIHPANVTSSIGFIELNGKTIPKKILELVPEHIARHYQIVPITIDKENNLHVAMIDPEDQEAIEVVKKRTGYNIKKNLTTINDINYVLGQYSNVQSELAKIDFEIENEEKQKKTENIDLSENSPAAQIVEKLLIKAAQEKASDVHFEPMEKELMIRFRKDGMLKKIVSLPKEIQPGVITRLKILASLRLDEQRLPQDGRFQITLGSAKIDLRVSSLPTVNGEKVVLRLLNKEIGILKLDQVEIEKRSLAVLRDNLSKSHGMILVTGPTGSGKSTTLYAMLAEIMNEKINIITLEDPVEYRIETINQAQVNMEIGFTFAKGLRSILRQDPDVIMVGEIRDEETASISIHSALTGHLVFSTLHTNSAAGAIPRMIDMGVEPFLIASSVNCVMAQRLARKICSHCKIQATLNPEVMQSIQQEISTIPEIYRKELPPEITFYKGKGCDQCQNTGYSTRIGLYEILDVTPTIIEKISKNTSTDQIFEVAIKEGMLTLKQDGLIKAINGLTTIEEVWRVTKE